MRTLTNCYISEYSLRAFGVWIANVLYKKRNKALTFDFSFLSVTFSDWDRVVESVNVVRILFVILKIQWTILNNQESECF